MKVQIRARNQITLPEKVVNDLGLSVGDDLLVEIKDGSIVFIPALTIPRDAHEFLKPEWQEVITGRKQRGNA